MVTTLKMTFNDRSMEAVLAHPSNIVFNSKSDLSNSFDIFRI